MRVLLPLLVVSATGCDALFGLDRLELDADGGSDSLDAATCTPIGHDEDGDGLDDACDPCPFDTRNDGDEDGDGIALACDPDPATPNELLLFSGFDPLTRAQFTLTDGAFAGDAYTVLKGSGPASLLWDMDADHVWVIAGLEIGALGTDTYREVGIIFEATPTTASTQLNGTLCIIGRGSDDYLEVYQRNRPDADQSINISNNAPIAFTPFTGLMRASYSRSEIPAARCTFISDAVEASIGGTPMTAPPPGKLALYADDADTRFHFLFVARKP